MDIGQLLGVAVIFLLISMIAAAIIQSLFLMKILALGLIFLSWGVLFV